MAADDEYTLRVTDDNTIVKTDDWYTPLYLNDQTDRQLIIDASNVELVGGTGVSESVGAFREYAFGEGITDETRRARLSNLQSESSNVWGIGGQLTLVFDVTGYHLTIGQIYGRRVDHNERGVYCENGRPPEMVGALPSEQATDYRVRSIPRLPFMAISKEELEDTLVEQGFVARNQQGALINKYKQTPHYKDTAWFYINKHVLKYSEFRKRRRDGYLAWLVDQHLSGPNSARTLRFRVYETDCDERRVIRQTLAFIDGQPLSLSIGTMAHDHEPSKGDLWQSNLSKLRGRYLIKKDTHAIYNKHIISINRTDKFRRFHGTLAYDPHTQVIGNQLRVEFFSYIGTRRQPDFSYYGHIKVSTIIRYFLPYPLKDTWSDYMAAINPPIDEVINAANTRAKFLNGGPNGEDFFPGAGILAPPEVFANWTKYQQILYLQKLRTVYFDVKIAQPLMILGFFGSYAKRVFGDVYLSVAMEAGHFLHNLPAQDGKTAHLFDKNVVGSYFYANNYYTFIGSCILSAHMYYVINNPDNHPASILTMEKVMEILHVANENELDMSPFMDPDNERLEKPLSFRPKDLKGTSAATVLIPRPGTNPDTIYPGVYPNSLRGLATISVEQAVILRAQARYYANNPLNWEDLNDLYAWLYDPATLKRIINETTTRCDRLVQLGNMNTRPDLNAVVNQVLSVIETMDEGRMLGEVQTLALQGIEGVTVLPTEEEANAEAERQRREEEERLEAERQRREAAAAALQAPATTASPQSIFGRRGSSFTPTSSSSEPSSSTSTAAATTSSSSEAGSSTSTGRRPVEVEEVGTDSSSSSFDWTSLLNDTLVLPEEPLNFEGRPPINLFAEVPYTTWESYAQAVAKKDEIVSEAHRYQLMERFPQFFTEEERGRKRAASFQLNPDDPIDKQIAKIEAAIRKRMPRRPRMAKFLAQRIHQHLLAQQK